MSEIKGKNQSVEKNEVKRFKDFPLDNQIKRALSELGFQSPLEVQSEAIPKILEGKDLIVKSQTGSGKTAAFAIPLCEKVDTELEAVQVLVLAPTRELVDQVREDFEDIGRHKGVRNCALYGKQPMERQRRELKTNPHVIVATPGRMLDHLKNRNVKLNEVKYLVIDEADEMLIMGFKDQIDYIISKLPEERTTLLFSATMPEAVEKLSQSYMNSPEQVEVKSEVTTIEKIEQLYYSVDGLKKVDFIKKVIRHEQPRKCIIFCNTQEQVDNLFEIFSKWDRTTCAVHGGMDQGLRTEKLKEFKRGKYKILIATDVAARGLHIQGITHVINYGVPFDHENYVHRIGRTGRVDQEGVAITMVMPSEMERFQELEKFLGYEIPCRGGYIDRAPRGTKKHRRGKEKFKDDKRKGRSAKVQINAGMSNSTLRTKDILYAVRKTPGISSEDIGKVDILDKVTNITIYNGKENEVARSIKKKGIRGKLYRVK
jgi:ATP-dependent RNA helicase DeaD